MTAVALMWDATTACAVTPRSMTDHYGLRMHRAYPCGQRWVAAVRRDGQLHRLGRFSDRDAALAAVADFRTTNQD